MAHMVKCFYCGKTFDRDKEEFVQVSARRYAHKNCTNDMTQQKIEKTQEEKDRSIFYQMVKNIYGKEYNYMLINTQATNMIKEYGYTWSGMAGCLHWFYNINHGSLEEGNGGIGIIPYIYEDCKKYYQEVYKAQKANENKKIMRPPVEFSIQSPRAWHRPPHLLNLDWEEDNE